MKTKELERREIFWKLKKLDEYSELEQALLLHCKELYEHIDELNYVRECRDRWHKQAESLADRMEPLQTASSEIVRCLLEETLIKQRPVNVEESCA